jgi:hypothetical protein
MVLFSMVSTPSLKTPAPWAAELPLMVQFATVPTPPKLYTPPPGRLDGA